MVGPHPEFIPPARPIIGEAEIEAAVRVLRSGRVVQGPEVAAFEQEFADLVAGRHCVAVNSGTSALHLSLMALGFGPGDEVIVPSFSFAATANAVRLVGAEPVFADIEPGSFCLDPEAVAAAITPRTVAIMPVHLYGHPAAMDRIMAIAQRHGLAVVEDAAQAHGAALHGTPVGAFGTAGCFSFYPTKNMHSLEGGMVTTADAGARPHAAAAAQPGHGAAVRQRDRRRQHADDRRGRRHRPGAARQLAGVDRAAPGQRQVPRLRDHRHGHPAGRRRRPARLPPVHGAGARRPGRRPGAPHRAGIGNAVYYPTPIHRLKPYLDEAGTPGPWDLPETERAAPKCSRCRSTRR